MHLQHYNLSKLYYNNNNLKNNFLNFLRCILYNQEISVQLLENFFNKCSPVFVNLIQILGNNKARQREKFAHILEDLASLQEEVRLLK